jgi:RNA polymerase subunit RPABC4/transcription elongation factor Spt4
MDAMHVYCAQCRTAFPPAIERCPQCGSNDILITTTLPTGAQVAVSRDAPRMRVQGRHGANQRTQYALTIDTGPGLTHLPSASHLGTTNVAPHIKFYNDIRWNHDRQRMERYVMQSDKERDYYKQEWFSLETGKTVWVKEGKLSDPDMHGKSARRGKAK